MPAPKHELFFDGVCVMCDHSVHFIHARDRHDTFRFAALQGPRAHETLARYGKDAAALDGVYLLVGRDTPHERLLWKYAAVRAVLRELGGGWKALGWVMGLVPRPLGDWFYDRVARNRYRLIGKYEACPIPGPDLRAKFLADGS
ncbi:thiol-disulfide oxidoreductase DCC family protein [Melittangium boletus]|uniref:thiol-disulfide oxidoreductase DCC family protein n=1 Tax=Melittangium boletus TaxID=83453 RepID=UPI003DA4028B